MGSEGRNTLRVQRGCPEECYRMALPLSWYTDEGDARNMYKVAPFPKRFHLRSPIKINSKEHMKGCLRDVFCKKLSGRLGG